MIQRRSFAGRDDEPEKTPEKRETKEICVIYPKCGRGEQQTEVFPFPFDELDQIETIDEEQERNEGKPRLSIGVSNYQLRSGTPAETGAYAPASERIRPENAAASGRPLSGFDKKG